MAGFQVTLRGRIWVTAEDSPQTEKQRAVSYTETLPGEHFYNNYLRGQGDGQIQNLFVRPRR